MQVTSKLNLDMGKKSNPPIVYAMQNDVNSRVIEISLFSESVLWNVPSGVSASVAFKNTSDGHKGWYDTLPDGSPACSTYDNVVRVILAPAVVSSPGEINTVIVFQDVNLNQLATFNFSIIVEKNPAADISISNDYYAYSTMEDINEAIDAILDSLEDTKAETAPAIVCEASGDTISVSDASNRTLQGLTLYGKTTQNGTPTPEAPIELEGVGASGNIGVTVAGKNLLPKTSAGVLTQDGITFTSNGDGSYSVKGTAEKNVSIFFSLEESCVFVDGLYVHLMNNVNTGYNAACVFRFSDGAKSSWAFTPANRIGAPTSGIGKTITQIGVSVQSGYTVDVTFSPMFVFSNIATDFEPYKSIQTLTASTPNGLPGIPVSSGGNYTDESGQRWICDEIDFARGVYVQRIGLFDANRGVIGRLTTNTSGYERFVLADNALKASASDVVGAVMCSIASAVTANDTFTCIDGIAVDNTNGYVILYNSEIAQMSNTYASEWLKLKNTKVLYALATPTETALSAEEMEAYAVLHTNKPNTTVLNDAGAGMAVEYVADTKTYIDNVMPDESSNAVPELVPTAETAFSAGVIIPDPNKFISYAATGITGGADYEDGKIILHMDAAEEGSTKHVAGSIDVTDIIKNVKSIEISVSGKVTDLYLSKNRANWGIHAIKKLAPGFNDISTIDFTGIDKIYFLTAIYGYEPPSTGEVSFTIRPKGIVYADKFVGQEQYPTFADIDIPDRFITCWGDSLTAQGGWTNILADLSGRTVNNAGTGGENSSCIMARQGADVMLVNNITIPADATPVQVATYNEPFTTAFGETVRPLLQGGGGHLNPVTIAGVEGALNFTGSTYNDSTGVYTFTRTVAGDAVSVNRPTAVVTKADKEWNNPHLMIIFMGQNDGNFDVDELVNKHRLMIDHAHAKNVVVLGLSSGSASYRETYETAMRKAFGRHFISLREYLSEYGLADAGLTPTSADTTAMDKGEVPPQLLSDTVHYTDACKTVIGNMLYKKCCELGIFNY